MNQKHAMHNQFLTLSKGLRDLPEEATPYLANYTQGYNYLKQKNYVCKYCKKRFGRNGDLTRHIKKLRCPKLKTKNDDE